MSRDARGEGTRVVLDALRVIVRELRLTARDAGRVAQITGAQLFVMQQLKGSRALSVNELAARTMTDQSSVSVVVKRLVEARLVLRKPSENDARRLELSLTPAGKKLLARCPEPTQARLLASLERMSAEELDALTTGLGALVREMGIAGRPAEMFFEDTPSRAAGRASLPARNVRRRA